MKNILKILLLLCVIGCTDKSKQMPKGKLINVNLEEKLKRIDLNKIAKKITYIKVEDNNKDFIGDVSNVVFTKNKIFIQDNVNESIFLLDSKGLISGQISAKGSGPEEYYSIKEMRIDTISEIINILDPTGKMLKYSTDGKYLTHFRLKGIYPKSFICKKDKGYLFYTHHKVDKSKDNKLMRLIETNLEGDILKTMLETNTVENCVNFGFPYQLREIGDKVIIGTAFVNDILQINSNDEIKIAYSINFKGAISPKNPFLTPSKEIKKFYSNSDEAYFVDRFMKSDSLTYFAFVQGKKYCFYLSTNKHTYISGAFCDEFGTIVFPLAIYNNKLICYIDTPMLRKGKTKADQMKRDSTYKINYSRGTSYNPIFVIYEF